MKERAMSDIEARVRRLERQLRVLVVLLVTALAGALAVGSIAVSNAQPTVITAQEVRAQRFSLIDPNGGLADDWYTTPTRDDRIGGNVGAPYSGWAFSKP
jgi:hypothetical protein